MKFDKSKIYTAANADEVKVGSKGYFADNMADLEETVISENKMHLSKVNRIASYDEVFRFYAENHKGNFALFYLVKEPAESKSEIKEVTAAEWDNKPRVMKIWNDDPENMTHAKVVHILANSDYPVIAAGAEETSVSAYRHCAEIAAALEARDEASEKSYRPYNNAKEFISDFKRRFCPDCKGIPAIWVQNVAGTLKMVNNIADDGVFMTAWINYSAFIDTYTYPDGSPAGAEI